ncbi:hypothetical protein PVAND_009645 [Polypedilum vanderplanki]|uniref:Uncharacterized protein n=1 Tax=Polypedilum vanderplanki TaxID=319348 RepID=A0A9J6CE72_POLVA|nr:hypothetical protein PVAND_009645 [Polypedilum vanderplanki]
MRHQNQNNQDDQRSIGSIGYIGGNIGYMGSMTMEYPYEHQNSHFQLWKPFFPRGEAPPPYEEAISMAQTESLNTQAASCTVSVATSTHRTLPMNVCNNTTTDNTDLSAIPVVNNNPITSNTTNLINININNAGNITAVATGENHLIQSNGNYLSATPNNTLPRHANTANANLEQDLVNRAGSITFNPAISNCSNSDLTVNSSMRDIPCTLQNCDLNTSCSLIRSTSSLSSTGGTIIGSGGCYSAPSTMKINQQNQTSNQSLAQILATNQSTQNLYEHWNSIDCLGTGTISQTILPPPLFDTNCTTATNGNYNQCYEIQNHPGNYCTLSAIEMPKMPSSSSKRLHRTIPKHFTMSSPSSSVMLNNEMTQNTMRNNGGSIISSGGSSNSNNSEHNKKSSCQCPVQHVPMTYMQFSSSGQVTQSPLPMSSQPIQEIQQQQVQQQQQTYAQQQRHQQHSAIYMSSSGGSKKNNVIKSTTFPSAMNVQNVSASASGKIQTITNSNEILGADMLQAAAATTHIDMGASIISSGSGTLRRSHKALSNSSSVSGSGMAMPTTPNKKSIATISVAQSPIPQSTVGATGYFTPTPLTKLDGKPQQIHSILKNKNSASCHINVINVTDACNLEQNPILPPKMYKNNNGKYSITPTNSGPSTPGSKQIHTITRPNELTTSSSQFTLLSINGSASGGSNSGSGNNGNNSNGGSAQQKYQQQYHQQPTQLRTNIQGTLYNTKSLPRAHGCESEKNRLTNYSSASYREQQQQQQSNSNYSTNTLPKNHHQQQPASQQIYGKVTNPSRSLLNDVVNKVPSVIMLPLPSQQQQLHQSSSSANVNTSTNNNNLSKGGGISMIKKTSSKDNLCDSNNDDRTTHSGSACHSQNSTLKRTKSKKEIVNANEKLISSKSSASSSISHHSEKIVIGTCIINQKCIEKPLPVLTTSTNCTNPKEHFLPNETSLDDDYLSECENCKTAGTGSRYYLDDEEIDEPIETMTLQRKIMNENDENDQQNYYRVSSTLPTNTNKKAPVIKNREPWFTTIPASSSSDEETLAE